MQATDLICLFVSAIIALAISIPLIWLAPMYKNNKTYRDKVIEKARSSGCYYSARLESQVYVHKGEINSHEYYLAKYSYTDRKGRRKTYTARVRNPAETMYIFYNPHKPNELYPQYGSKAFSTSLWGVKAMGGKYIFLNLIPVILWVVIYKLLKELTAGLF